MLLARPVWALVAALFSGALQPLAFAPFGFWPLGLVSVGLLHWLWHNARPWHAWQLGFYFGLGFFGLGLSWIFISIHRFGDAPVLLAAFFTLLLVIFLSFLIGLGGYLQRKFYKQSSPLSSTLAFASIWVLVELVRSTVLGGFPWLLLGNSAIDSPLKYFAPAIGVYGLSWILAFLGAACGLLVSQAKSPSKTYLFILVALFCLGGYGLSFLNKTENAGPPLKVSLIQGNIKPMDKFLLLNPINTVWQTYGRLSQTAWSQDLIVWPENAIPVPYNQASLLLDALSSHAHVAHNTVIVGIPKDHDALNDAYYNTLVALDHNTQFYYKRHLVPFGEFLPLDKWLRGLIDFFDLPMSNFKPGPAIQPLIRVKHAWLAPYICYEMAFPELVRKSLGNAGIIITLSEDGWFGDSLGPHQNLEIARMRALETGRPVIRATTSGISAFIDSQGRVLSQSAQFEEAVLQGLVYPQSGTTGWVKLGLPFILASCFAILLFLKLYPWIRKSKLLSV